MMSPWFSMSRVHHCHHFSRHPPRCPQLRQRRALRRPRRRGPPALGALEATRRAPRRCDGAAGLSVAPMANGNRPLQPLDGMKNYKFYGIMGMLWKILRFGVGFLNMKFLGLERISPSIMGKSITIWCGFDVLSSIQMLGYSQDVEPTRWSKVSQNGSHTPQSVHWRKLCSIWDPIYII